MREERGESKIHVSRGERESNLIGGVHVSGERVDGNKKMHSEVGNFEVQKCIEMGRVGYSLRKNLGKKMVCRTPSNGNNGNIPKPMKFPVGI